MIFRKKMSQLTIEQTAEITDVNYQSLYKIGGIAVLLQLACLVIYGIVSFTLGPKPGTVEEYFSALQANLLAGLLRSDVLMLILIALYFGYRPYS
jgi:hypothetical protein